MSSTVAPSSKKAGQKKAVKPVPMTKADMVRKMLADQQFIREARQKGISFQELREKYGYQFTTV
jgi:hypothetical protein